MMSLRVNKNVQYLCMSSKKEGGTTISNVDGQNLCAVVHAVFKFTINAVSAVATGEGGMVQGTALMSLNNTAKRLALDSQK